MMFMLACGLSCLVLRPADCTGVCIFQDNDATLHSPKHLQSLSHESKMHCLSISADGCEEKEIGLLMITAFFTGGFQDNHEHLKQVGYILNLEENSHLLHMSKMSFRKTSLLSLESNFHGRKKSALV